MTNAPHTPVSWFRVSRPGLVVALLVAGAVEALLLWAYTVWGIFALITGDTQTPLVAVALLACTGGAALLVTLAVRALGDAKVWARGPLITMQLLAILVGVSLMQGGLAGAGIAVIIWCVLVLVLLFSSEVTRFTGMRGPRE